MEETTGNRVTPYEDFADLFPAASEEPEKPAAQPVPEGEEPAAAGPGDIRPGPDRPARDAPQRQDIMSTVRRVLPATTPALALVALAAGGGALWLTHKQAAELDALHASLASLQADVSNGFEIKREVAALTSALQATQSHLAALDDAVAQQITSASQPTQLRDLAVRLDTLTAAVEELHARATDTGPAVSARAATGSTRPLGRTDCRHLGDPPERLFETKPRRRGGRPSACARYSRRETGIQGRPGQDLVSRLRTGFRDPQSGRKRYSGYSDHCRPPQDLAGTGSGPGDPVTG